mgnify:CR=1 FL=1
MPAWVREMGAFLGISALGPVAGGFTAAAQSFAMGGALTAPLMWPLAAVVAIPASLVGAGAVVQNEWRKAQAHGMGVVNGIVNGSMWVIVCHNWEKGVQIRSFAREEIAKEAFDAGLKLRRILLRLNAKGEADEDNGWGWELPWSEKNHDGCRDDLDNEMRSSLLRALRV